MSNTTTQPKIFDFDERIVKPIFNKFYVFIVLVLIIIIAYLFILSFINLLMYLYYSMLEIILFIFNQRLNIDTLTYNILFDYFNVTETDYSRDKFYIFNEQSTLLKNTNILYIAIASLFLPLMIYLIMFVYFIYKSDDYVLRGSINYNNTILLLIFIIFIFSFTHMIIFNGFFGKLVYGNKTDTIDINKNNDILTTVSWIKNIDNEYIYKNLYLPYNYEDVNNKNNDANNYYILLLENRLDDINNDINELFKNDNSENNMELIKKKVFTYTIYQYLIKNIKNYEKDERLSKFIKGDAKDNRNSISFIGLLQENKKQLINRYYNELNFAKKYSTDNNIPKITNYINNTIKDLNNYIINIPNFNYIYFKIGIYILLILLLNSFVFALILYIIYLDTESETPIFPKILKKLFDFFKK